MLKIYGSMLCPDCVQIRKDLDKAGVEYEYLDMVEYKHFDHIYWEVVYNFIMTLEEPTNITICSPTKLNFEKYAKNVYEGKNIEEGKRSIAFSLKFEDYSKTLTDEEVSLTFNKVISEVEKKYNAVLRDN